MVLCSAFVEPLVILLILVANGELLTNAFSKISATLVPGLLPPDALPLYDLDTGLLGVCVEGVFIDGCSLVLAAIVGVVTETNAENAIAELKSYEVGPPEVESTTPMQVEQRFWTT